MTDLKVGLRYKVVTREAYKGKTGRCIERRANSFGRVWGKLRLESGEVIGVRASDCERESAGYSAR